MCCVLWWREACARADAYASVMVGYGCGTACNVFGLGLGLEQEAAEAVSVVVCAVQDGVQLHGHVQRVLGQRGGSAGPWRGHGTCGSRIRCGRARCSAQSAVRAWAVAPKKKFFVCFNRGCFNRLFCIAIVSIGCVGAELASQFCVEDLRS